MHQDQDPQSQYLEAIEGLKNNSTSPEHEAKYLAVLEENECWDAYFAHLQRKLAAPDIRKASDYINKARIENVYLEDHAACAETCKRLVVDLEISYQDFHMTALENIIEKESYSQEGLLLQSILLEFKNPKDRVECLERLCLIYEKKYYDEYALSNMYQKLIDLAPLNTKALRYFKMVYSQSHEWDKVSDTLEKLLATAKHSFDKAKIALELASINLYQLDAPSSAISLVEEYCQTDFLDTSVVAYDAYLKLGNLEGAVKVLIKALDKNLDLPRQIAISLKVAELFKKMKRWDDAILYYEKALPLATDILEPFDGLCEIYLMKKDWDSIVRCLKSLAEVVIDSTLRLKIVQCHDRILTALVATSAGSAR